jgi:hypothetical protein
MEVAPTCFGLQGNHHQGANCQYLAKIIHLVKCGYIEVVQTLSVLWLHHTIWKLEIKVFKFVLLN